MSASNRLETILAHLGSSRDAVAGTLKSRGIKGVRNTARYLNPVVRFVQGELRLDDYHLDVTHGDALPTYTLRMTLPSGAKEEAVLPEPVKAFLDAFNSGGYPGLELPNQVGPA